MKVVPISKCEIEIIECDCGYHMGIDTTYLDQVEHFIAKCPSCDRDINTIIIDEDDTEG